MILLFEGMRYRQSDLKKVFGEKSWQRWTTRADKSGAYVSCVGYFYNAIDNCQYFIMPKVFVFNGKKVFGMPDKQADYKDRLHLIDLDEWTEGQEQLNNRWAVDVIHKLPVYIFLAIKRYRNTYQNSVNNEEVDLLSAAGLEGSSEMTYLEMILALQDFYNDHKQLFIYIYKLTHSGTNKIDWVRTIHTQQAYRNDDNYIYSTLVNKRKSINLDERLLVIFFSTLRYAQDTYNFPLKYECWYHLDSPSNFKRLAENGMILRELKGLRQNYFRDELQKLWKLLYNFYDIRSREKSNETDNQYLMVRKFDRIFEDMVNELIGDKYNSKDQRNELIYQKDDKIVDHLFLYRSIDDYADDHENNVNYIGDSKYYKEGNAPEGSSFFKQYTYARNVIQTEITWFLTKKPNDKYRNNLTEGYKITPNFFILGKVLKDYDFKDSHLVEDIKDPQKYNDEFLKNRSVQWENRLFDRDTLFLEKYNINFLFVLYSYVHNDTAKNRKFKEYAKQTFRKNFIDHLNGIYEFKLLKLSWKQDLEDVIYRNFKDLNGRIYLPFNIDPKKDQVYLLFAYEKGSTNEAIAEQQILLKIRGYFNIMHYKLGESIEEAESEYNVEMRIGYHAAKGYGRLSDKAAEDDLKDEIDKSL